MVKDDYEVKVQHRSTSWGSVLSLTWMGFETQTPENGIGSSEVDKVKGIWGPRETDT